VGHSVSVYDVRDSREAEHLDPHDPKLKKALAQPQRGALEMSQDAELDQEVRSLCDDLSQKGIRFTPSFAEKLLQMPMSERLQVLNAVNAVVDLAEADLERRAKNESDLIKAFDHISVGAHSVAGRVQVVVGTDEGTGAPIAVFDMKPGERPHLAGQSPVA
jgi:hypothetical protein